MKIRVLVVDDHPFYRAGVKSMAPLLDPGIEIVGEAADGAAAVEMANELVPDVILMDLALPGMSGVDATRLIRTALPSIAVLVLTMLDDDSVLAALEAGAGGYLLKDASVDDVCRAIRSVHHGELVVSARAAPRLLARARAHPESSFDSTFSHLTARERDVLQLVASGASNAEIARRLYLTPKTVRNYVSALLTKLGVDDREAAATLANGAPQVP